MQRAIAYAISAAILGFGVWIFVASLAALSTVVGLVPRSG